MVGLPDGIRHVSRAHPTLATYGYIITTTGQQEHSSCLADCCRHCPVRITHGVALRAFISVGEGGSRRLRVCCSGLGRVHVSEGTGVRNAAQPGAGANPAIALWLQSTRLLAVAESLGGLAPLPEKETC
jgi:hypothetical protein